MAPSRSTTLRVPVELRDEIARIADRRGASLVEVVADAVHRLSRDEWWDQLHSRLDSLSEAEATDLANETERLDDTTQDGLGG